MSEIIDLQFLGRIWLFGHTKEVYVDIKTGKTYMPYTIAMTDIEKLKSHRDNAQKKHSGTAIIGRIGENRDNLKVYREYKLIDFTNELYDALRKGLTVFENNK